MALHKIHEVIHCREDLGSGA